MSLHTDRLLMSTITVNVECILGGYVRGPRFILYSQTSIRYECRGPNNVFRILKRPYFTINYLYISNVKIKKLKI